MKKELSEGIGFLTAKQMEHVFKIIQQSMPHIKNTQQEEIELDVDQLDPNTLLQLYNFVVQKTDKKKPRPLSTTAAGPTKKKKRKPLTEAEQSRQIAEIEEKLREFNQATSGGAAVPHNIAASDDSSSGDDEDDASSDSSSEEE
jgi:bromodomain-containing factor 1